MGDYIIKKGDNLTNIAKEYGTTVKALQEANNIKNANKIIAGKTLIIPDGKGTTVEHTEPKNEDSEIRMAREEAHKKEVERMNAMKKSQVVEKKSEPQVPNAKKNSNVTSTSKTKDLVKAEMALKGVPEGNPKYGDAEYWSQMIDKLSEEFDFPKEIMIAKVSREVTFQKNKRAGDQYGAMQIRNTAVRAMFPGAPGNWHSKYKELDEKLLNDILYKKDANGNYLKDSKGNMIPKYSSWQELLRDCKNDEISLKVGILYDKMQQAEYITAKKYGSRKVYSHLSDVIAELKQQTTVSPDENLKNIRGMETRYNGSPKYGKAIADSIIRMGFNPYEPIIKKA